MNKLRFSCSNEPFMLVVGTWIFTAKNKTLRTTKSKEKLLTIRFHCRAPDIQISDSTLLGRGLLFCDPLRRVFNCAPNGLVSGKVLLDRQTSGNGNLIEWLYVFPFRIIAGAVLETATETFLPSPIPSKYACLPSFSRRRRFWRVNIYHYRPASYLSAHCPFDKLIESECGRLSHRMAYISIE